MMRWLLRHLKAFQALEAALEHVTKEQVRLEHDLEGVNMALEVEKTKRVAAESIATERRAENERLLAELDRVRESYNRLLQDRMKSLDLLNVKLMENRAPEPDPDMSQFKAVDKAKFQIVDRVRQMHRAMDEAIIGKFYPQFTHRGPAKEPEPVEEPAP